MGYRIGPDEKTYDVFTLSGVSWVTRNMLDESEWENVFHLYFGPLTPSYIDPLTSSTFSSTPLSPKSPFQNPIRTTENPDDASWNVGKTLGTFLQEKDNTLMRIAGVLVALILGALHGLLPGHAKTLVGAYIVGSSTKHQKKNILVLISSITASHTAFIVILAGIILLLNKGISATTLLLEHITAIGYILFGAYFIWKGILWYMRIRAAKQRQGLFSNTARALSRDEDCCAVPSNNPLKKTLLTGILIGANPCIDALAIFVLALGLADALYATVIVGSFSLGLALMLGIIAYTIATSRKMLSAKYAQKAETLSALVTIVAGICIVGFALWHFIT